MNDETESSPAVAEPPAGSQGRVYCYKDAGIHEHRGYIPLWLWVVALLLLAWGIYYLAAFWDAPAA